MNARLSALTLIVILIATPAYAVGMKEGQPFPLFTMADENNKMTDIGTLIDKPTIVYFTHNSCHYCTQIIVLLKRAEVKFGAKNIGIIGINIMAKDGKMVKSYKKDMGFTFPMFAGNRDDVLNTYKVNYVPVLVFMDSGKTVKRIIGHYIHEKELHGYIKEMLK
ncbi:TlpA family protein disulfide reductase [Candidatus Magnetominusculus xianensis]|uniref:Thiol-disulfide oxidoreductase n=1 Tax=Candidatus Magnetominusculus xianensis TaxID=1748249 RepID=A0ABR5SC96_9BACT|nr:redoxin domain-containing protein [Candidatus Magnetominusculus xianensis]KWT76415.1 thiol-disulfide oxidoreductase [Candidatus Magnetominusculus xianensis]MBF0404883.1 redoxin domain-containing protein [Nitrospirota bacterium]